MKATREQGPRRTLAALALMLATFTLASCGSDESGGPVVTAAQLNEEGWSRYIMGEYSVARSSFEDALVLESVFVEARLGLAWSNAQLGEYSASVSAFEEVIASGEYVADAFAGRAAASLELPDYEAAIVSADSALARDAGYTFLRQPAFDYGDLRLILAQSYFALARYDSAQAQVDIMDPSNGLDPGNPETWTIAGTAHPTYEAALAALIERLWALEGGL